ncbi:MAG: FG-GAP-like repeat-containing protein [Bacteroidales bacterium]|nr:FG-GAP-like repeat-containing protein [Bacteroidales bacterium]
MQTHKFIISVFAIFSLCNLFAQDDIIYRTQNQWNFDKGNLGTITGTFNSIFNGGAFTGDYNGDGLTDLCDVDFSGSILQWTWKINDGNGGWISSVPIAFGLNTTDKCVVGDFNGDGKTDIAVFRGGYSGLGTWLIDYSPCNGTFDIKGNFGLSGDIPLSGDFNADGVDDICVYRPSTGTWYVALSDISGFPQFNMPLAINGVVFGTSSDIPFVGDFNGDGYADMGLYRPSENKILMNLFSTGKPKFEHYADINGFGTVDKIVPTPMNNILAVMSSDIDNSRPASLPLATTSEMGNEVNLRHGWTCIFDKSLDVDKWALALKAVGINQLEYHPWMRAHEEIDPTTDTWNTYVGDDRLWTSKDKMKEKIAKFRAIGGSSICYTGIYAATPAFALTHSDWAMRNTTDTSFITYGNSYLYLMATNEAVNAPYQIDNIVYKNFNDYFTQQAIQAQNDFNWDGYRWDWYGLPDQYTCKGLKGTGSFSNEMSQLVNRLDIAVKNIRPNCTTTALQLPFASGDIPNLLTSAVVNHQFLELWPSGVGSKYTDLYNSIYTAKSKYPDKPVFANFYPQADMNLTTSWPLQNIDYQFATCISAGGYPAAQVVDGVAGFTDPVPFHGINYPTEVLSRIAKWNSFSEAYGAYFYYSNPVYLITDFTLGNLILGGNNTGVFGKVKKRFDKRTRKIDAIMVDLVNYGNSVDLPWTAINSSPLSKSVNIQFILPNGFTPLKMYQLTLDGGSTEIAYNLSGNQVTVVIPSLSTFSTLVLTSSTQSIMPVAPLPSSTSFTDLKFNYDAAGITIRPSTDTYVNVMEDQQPLVTSNSINGKNASSSLISDAFSGASATRVTPGLITFNTTTDGAIRIPISKFSKFKIAVRSNNTTACWFGFRLLKPSTTSPVWETRDLYYRVGYDQAGGLQYITLTPVKPLNGTWVQYNRNILADVTAYIGADWANAIVTAVHYGPIDRNSADYDNLIFMSPDYTDIKEISTLETKINIFFDNSGNLKVCSPKLLTDLNYNASIFDLTGRILYKSDCIAQNNLLTYKVPFLPHGAYGATIYEKNFDKSFFYSGIIIR